MIQVGEALCVVITETNYKKYYSLQASAANKRAGKLQSGKLEFIVQNFMIFLNK